MLGAMSDQQQPTPAPSAPPAYGYPGQAPAPTPATRTGGSLGLVALIVGIIGILIGVTFQPIVTFILVGGGDPSIISVTGLVHGGINLLVAALTLILGIIAVRTDARRLLGAVAIGIAVTQLAGILIGWVTNMIVGLILG